MSYTFPTISNMSLEVEGWRPKLIKIAATILFSGICQGSSSSICDCHTVALIQCQENKFAD